MQPTHTHPEDGIGDQGPAPLTEASISSPVFIDTRFRDIFQMLLLNGLSPTEKAVLWARFYKQRWVRWTGQLVYVTNYQARFRHVDTTLTYDVALEVGRTTDQPWSGLTIGRFYSYAGRLQRYEDGLRTIYLDQGMIVDPGPNGVPGTFDPLPEPTRQIPEAPKLLGHP